MTSIHKVGNSQTARTWSSGTGAPLGSHTALGPSALRRLPFPAFDLHVHAAPDVVARKCDDLDLARGAAAAGMAGFLLKTHHGSTVERAYLVGRVEPRIEVAGGVTLNRPVGGINPDAVDTCLRMGGRCVWMPTQSSKNHRRRRGESGGLTPLGEDGKLLSEVKEVLDLIGHADVLLATGHLSVEEILAIAPAVREARIERLVVTHAEFSDIAMPAQVQRELALQGWFIEHSLMVTTPAGGSCSFELIAANIRAVGVDHCVLTTDFGQPDNPLPPEGLLFFVNALLDQGFSEAELQVMASTLPLSLAGLR